MSLQFTLVKNLVGAAGSAGRTIYNSTGAPSASTGTVGDFYLDTQAYVLYGPKLNASSWSGAQSQSLIGPQGASTPQTLPQDFVANSFVVTPVSNDTTAVQFRLNNSSGTQLFLVDSSGNVTVGGTLKVNSPATLSALTVNGAVSLGSTLGVTGATTLAALGATNGAFSGTLSVSGQSNLGAVAVTSLVNTGSDLASVFLGGNASAPAPAFSFNKQTDTGVYLATQSTNAAVLAASVNATTALTLTSAGIAVPGTLSVSGATTLAALSASSSAISGSEVVSGTFRVSGTSTLGVTSTGALTATSLTSTGTTQSTGHFVTSNGTVSAPTFSFFNQQDTGMYLPTQSTSAAVLGLTVNATQALALSATGVSVPGTLNVTGSITAASTLAVTGAINGSSTLAMTGAITGQSTLTVTGAAFVKTITVTNGSSQDSNNNYIASVNFPGSFGGSGSYPASGISSDTFGNLLFNYQGRTVIAMTNPGYNSQAGTTPSTAFGMNFSAGAYTFGAGGATAFLIGSNGSTTIGGGASGNSFPCIITQQSGTILSLRQGSSVVGTFDALGNGTITNVMTAGGFTLPSSGAKITFGDGTIQTTAYTSTSANNQTKWIATSQGTTALPAFSFTANTDTGQYLKGSSANSAVLALSVNATDSLLLTSTGVTVPGILSVTGATNTAAITSSSTIKATAMTITASGGALTFGDNTVQTTAYTNAGANSQPKWLATSNGTTSLPAFTYSANTDTGQYLKTPGTSGAVLGVSVNATDAMTMTSAGVSVPGTLSVSGATTAAAITSSATIKASALTITTSGNSLTFGDGTIQTTAYSSTAANNQAKWIATSNGTTALPVFTYSANTDTGVYLKTSSGTAAILGISVNSSDALTLQSTGVVVPGTFSATGAATLASTLAVSGATTTAAITASGVAKATALTITASGGLLTFGDGTTQATAAASSGSASMFSATSNGTATAPVYTFTNNNDTGMFLSTQSTTAAVGALSANKVSAFVWSKTYTESLVPFIANNTASFNSTSSFTGSATFSSQTNFQANAVSSSSYQGTYFYSSQTGSAAAPQFTNTAGTYGMFTTASAVGLAANNVSALSATSTALTLPLATTMNATLVVSGVTTHAATVTSTTAAGTASFISSQGFKRSAELGHSYVTSTTAGQSQQLYKVIGTSNGATITTKVFSRTMPYAGSVVAIVADVYPAMATAQTISIYKNGSAVTNCTASVASNGSSGYVNFAKGAYPFAAGDNLYAMVTYTSAVSSASTTTDVCLDVEVGA